MPPHKTDEERVDWLLNNLRCWQDYPDGSDHQEAIIAAMQRAGLAAEAATPDTMDVDSLVESARRKLRSRTVPQDLKEG
jgi:hypothetical protein